MKSPIMALLIMISFLLIAGRSNGCFLMKNNLFIAPDRPSDFDPIPNALVDDVSGLHTTPSSVKSATNENTLSFRLSLSFQKTKTPQSPADSASKAEGDFNLLPKRKVTPSKPSPTVNLLVTDKRLSTSSNSHGVVHVWMIRPKSQTPNVHILKSYHSYGDDQVQQEKSHTRKLSSSPSPGRGHTGGVRLST